MPYGYAFPVALIAFATVVTLIGPRPRTTRPSYWGFWVTLAINEQPFLAFYLLAFPTIFAFTQGDIDAPGGWAVFAVAVLTVPGLAVLVRRALRTPAAFPDMRFGPRPWARILFAPLAVRRRDVTLVRDLAYGDAGKRNRLDVRHRHDKPAGAPILIFFHGGGFRMGSKNREARSLLAHLAARGWVGVSANYRFTGFPDAHVDAKRVVAWVRAHAHEYGGAARTVIVSGTSAGAHLASMLALTPNDPRFQPGFESADTSVDAAIGFSGYYGRVAGEGSSPLDHLGEAPPFLVIHGTDDSLSLVEDTRDFVAKLRAASSSPVRYAELPGAQHAFDLNFALRYSYVIEAVTEFAQSIASSAAE